ncbi:hypothetical protein KOR42_22220 [Thalassoglobus neptunius]|uniref:Squalene cyclase C-terminal domain-containing protein n=1 Tax=Thalassoglobus neptunius TaxID=1938619 RepID=A0A5C5X9K0_9PLAN|nr:prenyltransferase/squalene oxidase repeat-containing protein [Thalassoglobus neptunius]TWT58835.1 hypothetical protein KOR42_22220 [Thalassoglobus neptunius]
MSETGDSPQPRRKRKREPGHRRTPRSIERIRVYRQADWKRVSQNLTASLPGVAFSVAFHLILLVALAWIIIRLPVEPPSVIELGWSTRVDKQDVEESEAATTPIAIPSVTLQSNGNERNSEAETNSSNENTERDSSERSETPAELRLVPVSQVLDLRTRFSGSSGADGSSDDSLFQAIDSAIGWMARQQASDGSWDLRGPYPDGGSIETRTGATALALLTFLGCGQTHQSGEHQDVVARGLMWLQDIQRADGNLFDIEEQGREAHFYAHSQATIVLCEALALTGDESLREPATQAVNYLVKAQNPKLGGWRYRPLTEDGIGDLSVTGWALMALHSARVAEIPVGFETFLLAEQFLNSVQESPHSESFYRYRPDFPAEESQRLSMTAEGLLCRQWLGWPSDYPPLRIGVRRLVALKNEPQWTHRRRNVYAWYYVAQVLHNLDSKEWDDWFSMTSRFIVENQTSSGPQRGSWNPNRPLGAFQERSQDAGRLYLTAMCTLILETPIRHRPLYSTSEE